MRVFYITQDEPVYAPFYLGEILRKSRHEVVGITALSPARRSGWLGLARDRWRIYGLRDFAKASGLYVWYRIRDRLPTGEEPVRFYSIARLARHFRIPVYSCRSVNASEYVERLRSLDIDVLVSIAANQRFKTPLLQTPRLACINIHSALLPKYRGLDGLFWALAQGETEVGVTVHVMNERFDDGAIVGQRPFDVEPSGTLHRLYLEAIAVGSSLVAEVLDRYASEQVVQHPNDAASGSYFSAPTHEAVKRFRQRGYRFF